MYMMWLFPAYGYVFSHQDFITDNMTNHIPRYLNTKSLDVAVACQSCHIFQWLCNMTGITALKGLVLEQWQLFWYSYIDFFITP